MKNQVVNIVKHAGALTLGAANAWSSNQVLGAGRIDAAKQGLTDSKGVAFQIGQKFGDVASMLTGGAEIGAAGVGEIATLGIATPVALPVAAHGLSSVGLGLYNLLNGRIVYSTSSNGQSPSSPAPTPKYSNKEKPPLPSIDATGKVHGDLPKVQDFGKYSKDELKILLAELKRSVQKRIEVTSKLGRDRGHGQRQGAEQDLIKSLEKYLGGN